jgi:hypothetical protein
MLSYSEAGAALAFKAAWSLDYTNPGIDAPSFQDANGKFTFLGGGTINDGQRP